MLTTFIRPEQASWSNNQIEARALEHRPGHIRDIQTPPDDRLREAFQSETRENWIASSLTLLAMTAIP